ncbi:carbonic anhydrase 1 [Diabrotica virgifera virgifera]|uniref:carbonic anhydrase n=1 Tax=Diabrotica virgifera virgifera TaxID=50390 RepID=A0A6P7GFD7_DIAVI|nr:carbonic anhydrase 1 [Diabrotica virgifera virgifera]
MVVKFGCLKIKIFVVAVLLKLSYGQDFGYEGSIGPAFWGLTYKGCNGGKLQSPIDIEINNVVKINFPPLSFENFDKPLETVRLENNGHTVQLSIRQGDIPKIRGGPLNGTYRFQQLHFHWGKDDHEGSENLINNRSYPLETHLVFYKEDYGNFSNALADDDGLTVLSFLYHITILENKKYEKFEQELPQVENMNSSVEIVNFDSLNDFTTTDRDTYFTYKGSLTTPPCSEVVTWIEFAQTIPLSHEQLQVFRLITGNAGKIDHNFRPVQAVNDRVIYASVPTTDSASSKIEHTTWLLVVSLFKTYLLFSFVVN